MGTGDRSQRRHWRGAGAGAGAPRRQVDSHRTRGVAGSKRWQRSWAQEAPKHASWPPILTILLRLQQIFDTTEGAGLTVDILINNAGLGQYGAFSSQPVEQGLGRSA